MGEKGREAEGKERMHKRLLEEEDEKQGWRERWEGSMLGAEGELMWRERERRKWGRRRKKIKGRGV